MTSRPGDELTTVPNRESVVIGSEDDYQDIGRFVDEWLHCKICLCVCVCVCVFL